MVLSDVILLESIEKETDKRMNDKNQKLLFSDSDEETVVITLTDEDGQDIDAEIMAALEIEEFGKEYVAVMPQQATEDLAEDEALILEYSEDAEGNPQFAPGEDEDEFEGVAQAFNQLFEDPVEFLEVDEDEEDDSDGFLSDIGDILPGISIKKD